MKRTTLFAIGLIASTVAAGAAVADGAGQRGAGAGHGMMQNQPGGLGNMGDMMQMMQMMHGQMMSDGIMGGGMMGGGMMGGGFDAAFDTDGDGAVSPDELRAGLAAQLKEYDADGNGVLSIAEFETLNSATIRNLMVDRFQALDEDGDGQITSDEMVAPAARMERMEMMRARGADGANGQMPMGQGAGEGMDQDDMMNNDNN
jgi:Ca2+-binding EF-hand superfamily protein